MFRGKGEPLCRKVLGMLSEYIDNRLSTENKSLVERHLQTCETCSKELGSLRMTVQLLHRVPEVPVPRSFTVTVPAPSHESAFGPASLRWLRPATAVATIVLVVLLVSDFLNVFGHEAGIRGGEFLNMPTGQTMLLSTPTGEGNLTATADELTKAIPAPTQAGGGNVTEGNNTEGNASAQVFMAGISGMQGPEGPPSIAGQEAVGWPLRQIEIAVGVVVLALATLTVFAVRQRRKGVSVR
jgi:hypothetical protein